MIQVILKVLKVFCGLGGQFVMPFIAPLINPSGWTVLTLCVFLPILFAGDPKQQWNSEDGKDRNAGIAFRNAFFIYYGICILCLCSLYQTICKVNDSVNPM